MRRNDGRMGLGGVGLGEDGFQFRLGVAVFLGAGVGDGEVGAGGADLNGAFQAGGRYGVAGQGGRGCGAGYQRRGCGVGY